MLRTNSKKARGNVWNYVLDNIEYFDGCRAYDLELKKDYFAALQAEHAEVLAAGDTPAAAEITGALEEVAAEIETLEGPANYAAEILAAFNSWYKYEKDRAPRTSKQDLFVSWSQGLPGGSLFDYWLYYRTSPVELLAGFLEETPEEAEKYSDEQAARLLTILIYNECCRRCEK